jgi:hypothetical protein
VDFQQVFKWLKIAELLRDPNHQALQKLNRLKKDLSFLAT